jgi:hypothetical protein
VALQIDKTTDDGYTVSYWRVSPSVTYDVVEQRLYARVLPYVSAAARQSGKSPVMANVADFDAESRLVELKGPDAVAAIVTGEPRDALYAKMKTKVFFQGATDVLE